MDRVRLEKAAGNQVLQYQLWLPTCGGVSMDLHVDPVRHRVQEPAGSVGAVQKLRTEIINTRPYTDTVWWYINSPILLRLPA